MHAFHAAHKQNNIKEIFLHCSTSPCPPDEKTSGKVKRKHEKPSNKTKNQILTYN